jgi:hypothetical protein
MDQYTAAHPAAAVAIIKAMQKQPGFVPGYPVPNGWIDYRFSDLCRRYGYDEARRIATQLCVDWVEQIQPYNHDLYRTFMDFLEAEQQINRHE